MIKKFSKLSASLGISAVAFLSQVKGVMAQSQDIQNAIRAGQTFTGPNANKTSPFGGVGSGGGNGIVNPVIGTLGNSPTDASLGLTFVYYFVRMWQALMVVGALSMIVYMIWGAVEWIVAGGDSGKLQKARDKMTQAVIGMVILSGSFGIIEMISFVFFNGQFNLLQLQILP